MRWFVFAGIFLALVGVGVVAAVEESRDDEEQVEQRVEEALGAVGESRVRASCERLEGERWRCELDGQGIVPETIEFEGEHPEVSVIK